MPSEYGKVGRLGLGGDFNESRFFGVGEGKIWLNSPSEFYLLIERRKKQFWDNALALRFRFKIPKRPTKQDELDSCKY